MSVRRETRAGQQTVSLQVSAPPRADQPEQQHQQAEVFTDPSGRRRRRLRRLGQTAMVALALCLVAVVVAMAGGPRAPFSGSRPQSQSTTPASQAVTHHHRERTGGGTVANPGSTSPSREMSQSAKPTPGPSASAVATNPAGHVPPGRNRTPNPKKRHV